MRDREPEAPALLGVGKGASSYRQLFEQVERTGEALRQRGVEPTDAVALVLPNGPETAACFLGVACHAACAPLSPDLREAELTAAFSALSAKAVIVPAGAGAAARAAAAAWGARVLELQPCREEAGAFRLTGPTGQLAQSMRAGAEDVALLLFTSGTTSRPKLVPLRHAGLCGAAKTIAASLALSEADCCLNVMPLFHLHALSVLLASLSVGARVACPPPFEANRFFEWMGQFEPTWYSASPTLHQAILERAGDHAALLARRPLRLIRSTSSPLSVATLARLEETFRAPVIEAYAITEAPSQVSSNPLPPGARKPGSVGRVNGPEVAILGPDGRPLPAGEVGEIALRGPHVLRAYAGGPEVGAGSFRDGWFITGDLGYFDADEYLYLTGRTKEIINRGGEKVAPREVEEAVLAHPKVAQAVAFAVPHPRLGQEVAVAVVPQAGEALTVEEVRQFAAERLASFKVPRLVRVVAEVPKGPTGKVQRGELPTKLGLVAGPTGGAVAPRTPLERELAQMWSAALGVEIGIRDDFFLAGGDSLLAASLFDQIEKRFGRRLSLSVLFAGATVEHLAEALSRPAAGPTSLVGLQPAGKGPPLYLVHGIGGELLSYGALARSWPTDRPLYGLRVRTEDGQARPFDRIEEMAAHYVREMREHQPVGPYYLGGYSFGGVVAFEMAQQLIEQGQAVGLLAMIDTDSRRLSGRRAGWSARRALGLIKNLVPWLREDVFRGGLSALGRRLRTKMKALLRRATGQARGDKAMSSVASLGVYDIDRLPRSLLEILEAHTRARQQYGPKPYSGQIVVFRARVRPLFCPGEPDLGWGELAQQGARVLHLPGNHDTLLAAPHVRFLAEALAASLGRTESGPSGARGVC